jgi:hypothetical protein
VKTFHETCIILVRSVPPDLTEKLGGVAIDLPSVSAKVTSLSLFYER